MLILNPWGLIFGIFHFLYLLKWAKRLRTWSLFGQRQLWSHFPSSVQMKSSLWRSLIPRKTERNILWQKVVTCHLCSNHNFQMLKNGNLQWKSYPLSKVPLDYNNRRPLFPLGNRGPRPRKTTEPSRFPWLRDPPNDGVKHEDKLCRWRPGNGLKFSLTNNVVSHKMALVTKRWTWFSVSKTQLLCHWWWMTVNWID